MYALDDLETVGYATSLNVIGYSTTNDLAAEDWAMIGIGAAVAVGVGALVYGVATGKIECDQEYSPHTGSDDAVDWLLNPANPASPISPLNPISPIWN